MGEHTAPAVLALFGPTSAGKTDVAIAVAGLLRDRGEDPVAVNCDALQLYQGLEIVTGAPSAGEQAALDHRLVGIAPVTEQFSAGRYAELAHGVIDGLIEEGRRPIVVGGTGLYLRAALSSLQLLPAVDVQLRERIERDVAERGAEAVHASLPAEVTANVHPSDRKRVARVAELHAAGYRPHGDSQRLWEAELRHPTCLVGLTMDLALLDTRIAERVDAMVLAGAADEVRRADKAGASRTARGALGFSELLEGRVEAMAVAHRRYARRQLTWMRKLQGVVTVDRGRRSAEAVAVDVVAALDAVAGR
ncbi:MAG: tRNA (adenosine(37)-N6)-dimethylallyltransferase [Solirubrobacterales bacterium]